MDGGLSTDILAYFSSFVQHRLPKFIIATKSNLPIASKGSSRGSLALIEERGRRRGRADVGRKIPPSRGHPTLLPCLHTGRRPEHLL